MKQNAHSQHVLDAPQNMDGALRLRGRPASRRARAAPVPGVPGGGPVDSGPEGLGASCVLDERGLHSGSEVVAADLAGGRRERMPEWPDVPPHELVPDRTCRVLGRSKRFVETDKRRIHADAGAGSAWLLGPASSIPEAFAPREATRTPTAALKEDDEVREAPSEAVAFPLSVLRAD